MVLSSRFLRSVLFVCFSTGKRSNSKEMHRRVEQKVRDMSMLSCILQYWLRPHDRHEKRMVVFGIPYVCVCVCCLSVLCFVASCCVVLCCAVLCCVVLCCVVLCCVVLCCVLLCCVVLCCVVVVAPNRLQQSSRYYRYAS